MAKDGVFSRLRRLERSGGEGVGEDLLSDELAHVLAVDDSLVDRTVIERLLKTTSCRVTAVDSGMRALQFLGLVEEESPVGVGFDDLKVDLIITDYCMPGMTGYELLKKIKGSSTFREIPVVIMSSENILARINRCLEEGAEDFIVKPVKLSDVKRLKTCMFGGQDRGMIANKERLLEHSDVSISESPLSSLQPPCLDNNIFYSSSPPCSTTTSSECSSGSRSCSSSPPQPSSLATTRQQFEPIKDSSNIDMEGDEKTPR